MKYIKEEIEILVLESTSFSEVLRKLGKAVKGGNVNHLKSKIKEFNIDISHFRGRGWKKFSKGNIPENKITIEKLKELYLNENSEISTYRLKNYLFRFEILENKCFECSLSGNWNGKPISLQLDHINGKREDNRLENLRILCPNCHSQTDTYSGKKNGKGPVGRGHCLENS